MSLTVFRKMEYMESYNKALAVMNAVEKCKGGAGIMILLIDNYDSFSYNPVTNGRKYQPGYQSHPK